MGGGSYWHSHLWLHTLPPFPSPGHAEYCGGRGQASGWWDVDASLEGLASMGTTGSKGCQQGEGSRLECYAYAAAEAQAGCRHGSRALAEARRDSGDWYVTLAQLQPQRLWMAIRWLSLAGAGWEGMRRELSS